jgi:hypothetical protein
MANDDQNKTKELAGISKKVAKGKKLSLEEQKLLNLEKKKSLDLSLKELEAQVKSGQLTQGQEDLERQIALTKKEIYELSEGQAEIDVERLAGLQKTLELTENLSSAINDSATQGGLLADKIAPISNSFSRAAVASLEAGEGAKGLGAALKAAFGAYAFNAAKGLSVSKMFFSSLELLAETTIKAVSALDSAGASFVQNTGASRDFARAAFETRDSLGLVGISGAEAVGVMGDLYSNFSEFSELSRGSQQGFIELSAQIEKLGGDAAGMAQTFTKVAGMSLAETETAMREVAGAADALGIPFSQVSADLVGMGELFAKMGDGALDVFLELQAAAKATGMSVQSLYNIVGQYDTFEASSQAAGRLNMVLGGNLLDTYSLLNATEEERIELLQRAMEQSSMTFDEMDRFQKREVSDALNISMEEASQLFGSTREEVRETAAQLMHAGMSAEELADRTREASTAMDKFKVLMGNLALIVGPLVQTLNGLVNGLLKLSDALGGSIIGSFAALTLGLIGAKAAFSLFSKAAGASVEFLVDKVSSEFKSLVGSAAEASEGVEEIAGNTGDAVKSFGKKAAEGSKGLLAFGAAMLMVGAGIGLAAWGMSTLVAAFGDLNGGQIAGAVLAIGLLGAAIVGLGYLMATAGAPAIAGFSAFGVAMLAVGAGTFVAALGVSKLVASFAGMDAGNILAIGESLLKMSLGALALAAAVAVLTIPGAGFGIRKLGKMFRKVREQIDLLNVEKVSSFATVLSSMAQLASMSLTDTGVPEYIAAIGKALDELPESTEKTVAFKATADSLANLMRIASTVEAEQVARIETIIGAVSNAEGAESTNQLVAAISRLVNERANNEGTTNVIELDGRVLAKWLDRYDTARFTGAALAR